MNKNQVETYKKGDIALWVIILNHPWIMFIFIIFILSIKSLFFSKHPLDEGYPLYRTIQFCYATDSTYNGYKIQFTSDKAVTESRLDEIRNRPEAIQFFKEVENSNISAFPNMINLDVYEFVDWIVEKGIPKDIKIAKITGMGSEKHALYLQQNPINTAYQNKVPIGSNQGMVYIEASDINTYSHGGTSPIYRYVDCSETSTGHDEQFTHIP